MNFHTFKLDLEKAEETEIKLPTSTGSSKKQESSRKKNIYFCFIDYAKDFDCVDHNKLWKILQEMGLSDHLICFLRNLEVILWGTNIYIIMPSWRTDNVHHYLL